MIAWLEESSPNAALLGGKGLNLGRLAQQGLPVPPAFVVTTEAYEAAVFRDDDILGLLRELDTAAEENIPALAHALRESIRRLALPPSLEEGIRSAYLRLSPHREPVAVRSSATAEDTASASFAGQQDTYLGVLGGDEVAQRIRDCWASAYTDRAVVYRRRHGFDHGSIAVAVVVQRLVDAEKAGVMFTVNQVTQARSQVCIEACWGLGEALVSGTVNPDHFVVDKRSGEIAEHYILPKREMIVRVAGTVQVSSVPVALERVHQPVLDAGEIQRLTDMANRVEAYFGSPQDIEWAIQGGSVYLLQSRPVTTLKS